MAHTLETRRFKDTATARSQRANPPPGQTRARMQGQAVVGGRDRAHIRAVAPATAGKLHERMVMPEQGGSSERRPFPST